MLVFVQIISMYDLIPKFALLLCTGIFHVRVQKDQVTAEA